MYKFKVFLFFFVVLLQYAISDAASRFRSVENTGNSASAVDETGLNSFLGIQHLNKELKRTILPPAKHHWPFNHHNTDDTGTNVSSDIAIEDQTEIASSNSPSTTKHSWHFGCSRNKNNTQDSSDISLNVRSLENLSPEDDNLELEVRQSGTQQGSPPPLQQNGAFPQQSAQPPLQQNGAFPQQGTQPPLQQNGAFPQQGTQPPLQQTEGFPQQIPQQMTQPLQMTQPSQMAQPQPMPQTQPMPQLMQNPQQPMAGGQMQQYLPNPNAYSQPQYGQPPYGQQPMGYPTYTPQFNGQMSFPPSQTWPTNGGAAFPYNAYPPTAQTPLPVPPNQFTSSGPPGPYTNPIYGTPLSPNQNNLETQIAGTFLSTQLANMLSDPSTRESLLYLVTELRGILSNPNAVPLIKSMSGRINEIMNTPSLYNQYVPQNVPHTTSTVVQVQNGPNHLLDKLKDKGGKIMTFVKEVADANGRVLEGTTSDIPVVNSFVRMGTGLANAGMGFIDGLVSPLLTTNNNTGTTTVTTVTTPQQAASFPANSYYSPYTTNGKR